MKDGRLVPAGKLIAAAALSAYVLPLTLALLTLLLLRIRRTVKLSISGAASLTRSSGRIM
jgi:hypothetical protein